MSCAVFLRLLACGGLAIEMLVMHCDQRIEKGGMHALQFKSHGLTSSFFTYFLGQLWRIENNQISKNMVIYLQSYISSFFYWHLKMIRITVFLSQII